MEKEKLSRIRSLQEKILKTKKEILPLEEELHILKEEKKEEQLSKYIGKYYKYKNSYSLYMPWYLYIKIIGVKNGELEAILCEKDCYNKIIIQKDYITTSILEKKINKTTFDKELKALIEEMSPK